MSNEKQKDATPEKPKTGQGSESTELDNEALDGVSGGMAGLQTAIKRALPLSAETGIPPQMGVRGIAGNAGSLAREDHIRSSAKSREQRFPPRECPLQ